MQDFEAPPDKIGADRDGNRDFDQLDDEFIPRHGRPLLTLLICVDIRFVRKRLERVKGIEPSSSAWKAVALPLSYTRRNASHVSENSPLRLDFPNRASEGAKARGRVAVRILAVLNRLSQGRARGVFDA